MGFILWMSRPLDGGSTNLYPAHQVVDHKLYGSRAEFEATVDSVLEEFRVEAVCLAGFMRVLTGPFVRKWNGVYFWR